MKDDSCPVCQLSNLSSVACANKVSEDLNILRSPDIAAVFARTPAAPLPFYHNGQEESFDKGANSFSYQSPQDQEICQRNIKF